MDFKDYYIVLGIDPTADADEIKRTYKKLARKYHPDVSDEPDAQSKFQEVSEAYEVLKNKDKRAEYDELRDYVSNPQRFHRTGKSQHFNFQQGSTGEAQFEDLLRSIFGDQRSFHQPSGFGHTDVQAAGRDIRHKLHVTLEEAFNGSSRRIRLGTINGEKIIHVKIPKGVSRTQALRLKGQGEAGHGKNAAAGDLYLEIDFEKHALFEVDGKDIILVLPVTPWEAALGASIEVPTLGGKVNLKVPANSQNGGKLRLKGRGLTGGDQVILLKLVNPKIEQESERAAFEQLAQSFRFNPRESMSVLSNTERD